MRLYHPGLQKTPVNYYKKQLPYTQDAANLQFENESFSLLYIQAGKKRKG